MTYGVRVLLQGSQCSVAAAERGSKLPRYTCGTPFLRKSLVQSVIPPKAGIHGFRI